MYVHYPNIISGCIDGTHIRIDPPKRSKDDYINRKGIISICLQAICNENKKFINMFVGYPGSSHDSWVFQNSTIYDKLPSYCGGNTHQNMRKIYLTKKICLFQIITFWVIRHIPATNI